MARDGDDAAAVETAQVTGSAQNHKNPASSGIP